MKPSCVGEGSEAGEGLFSKMVFGSGDLVIGLLLLFLGFLDILYKVSMLNGTRVIPCLDEEWSDYKVLIFLSLLTPLKNSIVFKRPFMSAVSPKC